MNYSPAIQQILDSKHGVSPEEIKKLKKEEVAILFDGLKNGSLEEYRNKISEVLIQAVPKEATPYFISQAENTKLPAATRASAVWLLAKFVGKPVMPQLTGLLRESGLPDLVAQKVLAGINRIGDSSAASAVQAFTTHQKLGLSARLGFNVMSAAGNKQITIPDATEIPLRATVPLKDLVLKKVSLLKNKIILPPNESSGVTFADNVYTYSCMNRDFLLAFNVNLPTIDKQESMVAGVIFYKKQFQNMYESSRVMLAVRTEPKKWKLKIQDLDGRLFQAGAITGSDFEIYSLSGIPNSPVKITGKLTKGEITFTTFQSGELVEGRKTPGSLPDLYKK